MGLVKHTGTVFAVQAACHSGLIRDVGGRSEVYCVCSVSRYPIAAQGRGDVGRK